MGPCIPLGCGAGKRCARCIDVLCCAAVRSVMTERTAAQCFLRGAGKCIGQCAQGQWPDDVWSFLFFLGFFLKI